MNHKQPSFDSFAVKVIVGLGNPGPRYHETRHNVGFMFVDYLLQEVGSSASWQKLDGYHSAVVSVNGRPLLLLKPMTGMNVSAQPIGKILSKRGIKPGEVLVCHDELEKASASYGFKFAGSARGHNGVRSFIGMLGFDFWRLRLGIGRPDNQADVADFVLERFPQKEKDAWPSTFARIIEKHLFN